MVCGIVHQQIDGVAMSSHLGLGLANTFLAYCEQIWLNDCPNKFKPVYCKWYIGDTSVLLWSPNHLKIFNDDINIKHANIKFTNEKEVKGSLQFLDILISWNNKDFSTTVYHKPTFSGVNSNFNSFIAAKYKHGLIFTLLFRIFSIVLDFSKLHEEVDCLKDISKKIPFPTTLVD